MLLALAATPADAGPTTCVVTGQDVTLGKVVVRAGASRFEVEVSHLPVVATARGRKLTVEVGGAIAFTASHEHKLWYVVARPVVTDLVTLAPAATIIGERGVGGELVGRAVVYASDVMPGEDKPADEAVSFVRVPCDLLTLDGVDVEDRASSDAVSEQRARSPNYFDSLEGDDTYWHSRRGNAIVLRSKPSARAAKVTFKSTLCEDLDCLTLVGLERRGRWRKVGVSNQGVTVTGWVPANRLVRARDGAVGYAYGCTGDHEHNARFDFGPPAPVHEVRMRVGTRIYARPNADVWATVQRDDEVFKVSYEPGDDWARVIAIPNIDVPTDNAFVLVSALMGVP